MDTHILMYNTCMMLPRLNDHKFIKITVKYILQGDKGDMGEKVRTKCLLKNNVSIFPLTLLRV